MRSFAQVVDGLQERHAARVAAAEVLVVEAEAAVKVADGLWEEGRDREARVWRVAARRIREVADDLRLGLGEGGDTNALA